MSLFRFHPAVSTWFERTFHTATAPQAQAWPAIRSGRHTLIAAPTGSGKTLAAFLAAIDALVREGLERGLTDETHVVYVSPLKALSNDIERNLQQPLAGIRAELLNLGLPDVDIRVQVRTGDTTQADRAAMRKTPPHILVTTPESLYLLLTSESGRDMLATTRTLIVDEIHAVAGSKRGSHLALSLERLAALAPQRMTRVGLSATQKPIEEVARFLVGADIDANGRPDCTIIDTGHVRKRDLALELPGSPLQAVMANEVWDQIYDRLAQLIQEHRTTLIFVNTRRLAERATRHLSERIGKEHVTSHHGSLAKESRFDAEQRLKRGELKALVATASLELGIDIGDVDLVCQLGSPRSIAAFLQRVGRSGHSVGGTPKGRLFPLTRDELIESAALLDAIERGELDRLRIPPKPLDVLAQQIVAEVAGAEWSEEALYERFRRAYPYRDLTREEYTDVVRMLADGFATRRGKRAAYLHRDAVNGRLRARKGARLTALTCGGAIPDNADYKVVLEPTSVPVGTVNEDFAVESMAGDIFQLGNASYRILKIEPGTVRVEDAKGAPPSIPFWLGEAPSRTDELSAAVSRLRAELDAQLGDHITSELLAQTREWLMEHYGVTAPAAEQIVDYLAAAKGVLHTIPTQQTVVFERFFDETGGMQLVIHAPFGNRVNRAWGLALRKRFCRKFNFELQAAATEDSIVLSLGETHSFPLEEVARYLNSASVRDVLVQALLAAPLFTTRWRWNVTTALAVRRFRGGRKNPTQFQRMDAEDLVAVVFPDQIACAENLAGDREVPDHPLVRQTIDDCLHEAMDIDGLVALLRRLERGEVKVIARDLPHPSPLAQEILNAKPYAFLDDAPLEERRTQAVMSRSWLDPLAAGEFGKLDPEAIARVRTEAWPEVADADELHDALMLLSYVEEREGEKSRWIPFLDELINARRAARLRAGANTYWVAAEQLPLLRAIHPDADTEPNIEVPAEFTARQWTAEEALVEVVRSRLQGLGPVTAEALAHSLAQSASSMQAALLALEAEGFVLRGQFSETNPSPSFVPAGVRERPAHPLDGADVHWTSASTPSRLPQGEGEASRDADLTNRISEPTPPLPLGEGRGEGDRVGPRQPSPSFPLPEGEEGEPRRARARTEHTIEWCERRLLARIHRYTVDRLRAEIEPVTAADFLRFLFEWQGVTAEPRAEGPQALAMIIEQLEGFEGPCMAWETDILRARMEGYDPDWLDSLCRSGRVTWARLTPPKLNGTRERAVAPVRSTPIALVTRRNLRQWQSLAPRNDTESVKASSRAQAVADYLEQHGASFFEEITHGTGLLKSEAEEALGELVALGRLQADSFSGLRALLIPADRRRVSYRRRRALTGVEDAGRWSLLRPFIPNRASEPTPPPPLREAKRGSHECPLDTRAVERVQAKFLRPGGNTKGEEDHSFDLSPGNSVAPPLPHSLSLEGRGRRAEARSARAEDTIEHIARTLLRRYGVVFRKLLTREPDWLPPWFELLRVYRRLEARGEIRGGRFVAGFSGEQYALPEAVPMLRAVRRKPKTEQWVSLSAADPLNLVGVLTPGARVPALSGNRVLYRDGVPVAVQIAGKAEFLIEVPDDEAWDARNALIRGAPPASTAAH